MNVVIAVKQFTYTPRKLDPTKLYTFQNDAEINYLAEQLITIRDLGITSREQMYDKAADLQEFIGNNQDRDDERQQLKRISELINAYEKIVEGNYIDNLIKAQKEQQVAQQHKPKPKHH
ncbi:MAG: hypothetical protein NC299_14200 [Lachnospiraceae bacterium]|nr:hypothetical protein [Ruminococcus sp.]MCM1276489.1 hypothetical protein [Lachnospiraceae bacterium]